VCQFAAEGLGQGAGVVVVARRLHRKGIERALAERGVDVAACHASGQLSMPDADTVLRDFLADGGMPDPGRFWAIFGSLVDAHLARFQHLRTQHRTHARTHALTHTHTHTPHHSGIYGEMVDILWSSDRRPAAIELENLWSQLAARQEQRGRPFSLLCGYAVGHFGCEEQTRAFLDLCGTHGRVVPAESYETLREHHNSQQHLIAHLQQQALALQAEVAHRRAVETELQLAKEQAEAANQAKSMFLAVISHELRTPLTAIVGYADLMLASSSSSSAAAGAMPASERGEIVEVISRNGRELVRLLNDVLDLSKVEAGSLQIDSVPFSPVELVSDVASVLRLQAREKQLSMRINIGPDVPARVLGDPSRLRQILVNLTSNAVKFTPAGGIIDMALRMRPPPVDSPPLLECIVRDTGCGMTPEHAQQLFQPFSQGETSASRQHGGAGLGLFLSRQLARLLGGDLVLAQTAPGQGTTFVATVPANTPTIIPDALEDQQAADGLALSRCELDDKQTMTSWSPPPDRQLQPIDCAAISVLVVDDNSVNRRLIQRVLQRLGYVDVACAANGLEALNHMAAHHCDLILMDLQMPMMGGHAACRAIRKIYQDQQRVQQPVIIGTCLLLLSSLQHISSPFMY
jgi:signal transduction histidine kinase